MFKIVIPDARTWRNYMSAIATLVEEATFDVKPEGIALRAMDPSHVAMVDFENLKTAFQEYSCDEAMKLCVDVGDVLKLMRRVESGETLELAHDPQAGHLSMKLLGKYVRRFSVPLLQPATSDVPVPKLSFDAKVKMDADCLNDAISDIGGVSEQVRLEANPERFVMTGLSETGNVVVEFEKSNEAVLDFDVKSETKALYGVSFLQDIIRAGTSTSKVVTVEFSNDKPVKLNFELPSEGKLTYYLAPRLE